MTGLGYKLFGVDFSNFKTTNAFGLADGNSPRNLGLNVIKEIKSCFITSNKIITYSTRTIARGRTRIGIPYGTYVVLYA